MEARTSFLVGPYPGSPDSTELQFGKPVGVSSGPALVLSDKYLLARTNVGIGTGGLPLTRRLDVVAADNNDTIVRIRSNNLVSGLDIGFNTIRKAGTSTSDNLNITAKGTGALILQGESTGPVQVDGDQTITGSLGFANVVANRRIVLFDVGTNAANDSAFYGLGINAGILRYQVPTGNDHVFYSNKTELMRVEGTGALKLSSYGTTAAANGLVTTAPTGYLAVAADGTIMQTANGNVPNIYTVDGTITGDRTVTLNGHTLNFLGSTGNFQLNATGNTFSTSANSLTMTETGDQFGAASLTLQNRTGQNGLLVTTGNLTTGAMGLGVTDLLMQTQGNGTGNVKVKQQNLRMESRSSFLVGPYSGSPDSTELQLGKPVGVSFGPTLVLSDQYALVRTNVGIGTGSQKLTRRLDVVAADNLDSIVRIRANNLTTGIDIGYNTIRNAGTNANSNLNITAKGTGTLVLQGEATGPVQVNGDQTISGNLGIGSAVGATATPTIIKLDSSFSSTAGANPKLYLFRNGAAAFGFGVSLNQLDYMAPVSSSHVFYVNGVQKMKIDANGNVTAAGTFTPSDSRLKSDIRSLGYGLNTILSLQPKQYNIVKTISMKDGKPVVDPSNSKPVRSLGFMAQDLYKLVPEAVNKPANEATDIWSVDYSKLVPILAKAIQEQQSQIDDLKAKNAKLSAQVSDVAELKTAMAEMKAQLNKIAMKAVTKDQVAKNEE